MTIALVFLVNAALNFGLSLLVAAWLGPDGFGRYALALAGIVLINTLVFEWLRLSTARFCAAHDRPEPPEIRASLRAAYAGMALLLAAATGLGLATGHDLGLSRSLIVATAASALAYALSEYGIALARARFLPRPFVVLALGRGLLAFGLAGAAAAFSGDPALVVGGTGLGSFLAFLLARAVQAEGRRDGQVRLDRIHAFARYGLPIILAATLYALIPLANRALLASRVGFDAAGHFALAAEIATRLFQNLGAAMDLALFQLAVRAEARRGRAAAERRVARNAALVAAVVVPAAFGLVAVWPGFEALFVPRAFQGQVAGSARLLVPALALFALMQYALSPAFQLRGHTGSVVAAAALALAVDLGLVLVWPWFSSAEGFAAAQLAGMAAAAALLLGLALRAGATLPIGDLVRTVLASAVMAAAVWLLGALGSSAATLALQVAAGLALYAALAFALDIAGTRRRVRRMARRLAGR